VTLTGGSIPAKGSCTVTFDVYAATGGTFVNSLAAGSLQTSNGSGLAATDATLTVIPLLDPLPLAGLSYAPAAIHAGGVTTLILTLSNPNTSLAVQSAPMSIPLPAGAVIAPTPNASSTCTGASITAPAGGSNVTVASAQIPARVGSAAGVCSARVDVTALTSGSFLTTLPANVLQTNNGNFASAANATLTVIPLIITLPPFLSQGFNPASILAGDVSTLTNTLSNSHTSVSNLALDLTDTLPAGLVVAPAPNASTTCNGSGPVDA
jgi:hypothetical protein